MSSSSASFSFLVSLVGTSSGGGGGSGFDTFTSLTISFLSSSKGLIFTLYLVGAGMDSLCTFDVLSVSQHIELTAPIFVICDKYE